MFQLMKDFMAQMFSMHLVWRIWLGALMFVNIVVPLVFIGRIEGQLTFAAAMVGTMIGMAIFKVQGFTRLMGVMHILWIPLVFFLLSRLGQFPVDDIFGVWLRIVILMNIVSLIIDVTDVTRYMFGNKKRAEA